MSDEVNQKPAVKKKPTNKPKGNHNGQKPNPQRKIVVRFNNKEYVLQSLKHASVKAPDFVIDLKRLRDIRSAGHPDIDDDIVRVAKVDKNVCLLTGFNVVQKAINENVKTISGKLISNKFMDWALVPPVVLERKELEDRLSILAAKKGVRVTGITKAAKS